MKAAVHMRRLLLLTAGIPLLGGSAFGWGCEGHQMIALIARAHLTPAASAAVNQLLQDNPIDPALKRFCENRPADPMADAATWADDTKKTEKTGEWHYVNIPLSVRGGDAMRWCAPIGPSVGGNDRPGCILNAIELERGILKDGSQPGPSRATALRYLIHFLGDLSQPLHNSDNHDEGGNCTSMKFFFQERPENLHGIWDSKIIQQDLAKEQASQVQYAEMLDKRFSARWQDWGESKTDVIAWAWEGQRLAAKVVYGGLPTRIPITPANAGPADRAACDSERELMKSQQITIGDAYVAEALPVIREQLAKAGYRLAGLLNRTFR